MEHEEKNDLSDMDTVNIKNVFKWDEREHAFRPAISSDANTCILF